MGHSTRRSTTMASDSGPEYDNSLARVINILVAIMNILVCCLIGAYAVIERIIPADDAQTVAVGVFVTLFALGFISSEIVRPRLSTCTLEQCVTTLVRERCRSSLRLPLQTWRRTLGW